MTSGVTANTVLPKAGSSKKTYMDPLAYEVTRDMYIESSKAQNEVAQWEHEDLAQVRIRVYRGHNAGVNKSRFFANDTRIVSASEDCSIKIWDRFQGTVLRSIDDAHAENAADVSCNEEGNKMVSCGWDHIVSSWDMETGKCIWSHTHDDITTCCQLSNDGRLVCVGSDLNRAITVYDLNSGDTVHEVTQYHGSTLTSCMFSITDTRIITTSFDTTAKFFDRRSLECTITLQGHTSIVSGCSITQDERKFATTSWDKTIGIWDISTGMYRSHGPTILKGSHDGSVSSCHFSNDSLLLVTGSYDKGIVLWDVQNNMQKIKLQGHAGWVTDVRISKDQNWLLTCSKDMTVRLWNIKHADKIPIVLEKKTGSLKVMKCFNCEKLFSMSELENFRDTTLCVFCRLKNPEQSWLAFEDD